MVCIFSPPPPGKSEQRRFGARLSGASGDNPEKLVFLRVPTSSVSTNGEYLDDWAMPYEIRIIATNRVRIRSAGANRIFGDADDLTNEH